MSQDDPRMTQDDPRITQDDSVSSCNISTECAFVFKARGPVDLVLLLNVHDHGPVHVPPVVPCKLREAIGQGPEVASDHVKCKNNARNRDFLVRGSVKKQLTAKTHIIF